MGVQISKRHKLQPQIFKLVLNFPSNGPHNTTGNFENRPVSQKRLPVEQK